MPIDIEVGKLEGDNKFVVKNPSNGILMSRSIENYGGTDFGKLIDKNRPFFSVGTTSNASWWNYATSNWAKVNISLTTAQINIGNHYDTSNTRFTAPIDGPYLFWWSGYDYSSSYWHPQFAVNGNVSTRRTGTPYRIRQHGAVANYNRDSQMQELIYLYVGDYVEVYYYAGGTGYTYRPYQNFGGMFVG